MENKRNTRHRRFIRVNGKILGRTFSRKADAERWYQEIKRQKELGKSGIQMPAQPIIFSDYASDWLFQRKSQGQPASSHRLEVARLKNHILPVMGARNLQQISAGEWEAFLNGLIAKAQISFATRNRIRSLLSKMYSDAFRKDLISHNPILKVSKSKEGFKRIRFLSAEECQTYLDEAGKEDESFALFAMIALNTGARCGEILALDWKDVSLDSRRIHIWKTFEEATYSIQERTKGGKDRWIGISDALFSILRSAKFVFGSMGFIVGGDDGKKFAWPKTIRSAHKRVCKRANLGHLRIHDLRHTYASLFMMNGGNLYELKEILGHSSLEMTKRYAHFTAGHLESKANLVSLGNIYESKGPDLFLVK